MSKIAYQSDTFTADGLETIRKAEAICQQYADQGYSLSLRQLYYRLIATDAFPDSRWFYKEPGTEREIHDKNHANPQSTKNVQRNYKWLGDLVSRARVAGMIDWRHLEDRTRGAEGGDTGWSSPSAAMDTITSAYGITHWDGQDDHVEVWVEKDALTDVISRPASAWDVGYLACKGSPSTSLMHDSAIRLRNKERAGKRTHVIYLGDFDPTGLDIDRDISERLALFGSAATVRRIALTMDQIEDLNPPPSPAKITDARAGAYIDQYGSDCWELDAIEPAALEGLVRAAILEHVDLDLRQVRLDQEEQERRELTAIRDNWDLVRSFLITEGLASRNGEEQDDDPDYDDDDE